MISGGRSVGAVGAGVGAGTGAGAGTGVELGVGAAGCVGFSTSPYAWMWIS